MTSIFRTAMGADFARLHPRLQERFGFGADDRVGCVGTGVMDRIWRGRGHTVPFLRLGTTRNILFPETGTDVPFTIENYAYRDSYGRETVTFVRTFEVGGNRRRRFDATMVHSPARQCIVDYLGTHQHVAVDLDLGVDPDGGLVIRSGPQRLHEGPVHVGLRPWLTGSATVRERYDDEAGCFRISVRVEHPRLGPVFGYSGRFTARYRDTEAVPAAVKPYREQRRD